jgi:hypothetical protein
MAGTAFMRWWGQGIQEYGRCLCLPPKIHTLEFCPLSPQNVPGFGDGKCLHSKCEVLTSNPSTTKEKKKLNESKKVK